jgi:hypothetical protein
MDPPFERLQEKSPLPNPYLTISLSELIHLLVVHNIAQHIGVYLTTGVLISKHW